jgi:hypothetical protein
MEAFDQPLDVVGYVDEFFKRCDPALFAVPEAGIASFGLFGVPAPAGDSLQGEHSFFWDRTGSIIF